MLKRALISSLSGIYQTKDQEISYSKLFQLLVASSSHLAFSSKEDKSFELLASIPDIELSSQVRDLFDSNEFKNLFYRFLPTIETTKLIRVPKLLE